MAKCDKCGAAAGFQKTICDDCAVASGMMIENENAEKVTKPQHRDPIKDANRLYNVANIIFNILMTFNWIIGISGALFAVISLIMAFKSGEGVFALAAFGILFVVAVICLLIYAAAVMLTHCAKVISNISLRLEPIDSNE